MNKYNKPLGKAFQAMVSVMAVNIQFSSPSIVLRSLSCPGILAIKDNNIVLMIYLNTKLYNQKLGLL